MARHNLWDSPVVILLYLRDYSHYHYCITFHWPTDYFIFKDDQEKRQVKTLYIQFDFLKKDIMPNI